MKSPSFPSTVPIKSHQIPTKYHKSRIFTVESLCFFSHGPGLHERSGRCHMQLGCWRSKTKQFAGEVVEISWYMYTYTYIYIYIYIQLYMYICMYCKACISNNKMVGFAVCRLLYVILRLLNPSDSQTRAFFVWIFKWVLWHPPNGKTKYMNVSEVWFTIIICLGMTFTTSVSYSIHL